MSNLDTWIDEILPATDGEFTITQHALDTILGELFGEDFAKSQSAYYTDAMHQILGQNSTELMARSGGWTLHLNRSIAQSSISAVVMGLMLKSVTAAPLSLTIIAAIIPYVFQIDKAQLTKKDEKILLHLYKAADRKGKTSDELYQALPAAVKAQVNRLDLLEFLESTTRTGHANEVAPGIFQLRHPDNPKFVITFD